MYDIEDKINFAVFPGRLYLAIVVNQLSFGWCGRTTHVTRATHVAARATQHHEAAASAPGMLVSFFLLSARRPVSAWTVLKKWHSPSLIDGLVFCLDWCRRL